ncbi:M48 family metalloprotease [Candidatus Berkiella aquae]|uniref:M48 family metalloprotease n=2 Tax=Candidatus Berkiella aquae TaxID=295108 RepID=A0AAE3HXV3_9GAMM|nr:M48 family metalloprotease [Candidatus Berkiella aquae]MCS5712469.1 M48 family metalloprotease [Candidatus Berkiella aquae]
MKELKSALAISNDVITTEYIHALGYRLLATQSQSQPNYQFFIVKDKTINAFALPGGFVAVNTGLILATEAESELAGVLAHEIGHVQQKHIARMYAHAGRLRLSTIAGMIASIIIATQSPQAAQGALAATLAGSQQALINFTRDHEKEADYVGIQTLAKAGFDPMGMPTFFHRMYQDTRYHGNHVPEYLMTHPLTEARMVAAQSRAKQFPYKQITDSLQYHLIHARVTLYQFPSPREASNHFAKVLARGNYRNRLGIIYGYALALIEEGKPSAAKPYLDELLAAIPDQPLFHLAYAQMEMGLGERDMALEHLATTLKNHPKNYTLTLTYADWLLRCGKTTDAISFLQKQVAIKSNRHEFWHLLSQAQARAKQPLKSHLAQAQYLKLTGDYLGALTQLRLAKKITPLSVQDAKQIEAELKIVEKLQPTKS